MTFLAVWYNNRDKIFRSSYPPQRGINVAAVDELHGSPIKGCLSHYDSEQERWTVHLDNPYRGHHQAVADVFTEGLRSMRAQVGTVVNVLKTIEVDLRPERQVTELHVLEIQSHY